MITPQVLLDEKTAVMSRETFDGLEVGIPRGALQVGTFWRSKVTPDSQGWKLWEVLPGTSRDSVELKSRSIELVP